MQTPLVAIGIAALTAILTGCGDGDEYGTVDSELEEARAKWADAELSNYQLVVTSGPNQLTADGCEWTTVVENDVVTSAVVTLGSEFGCEPEEYSVERLHDLVADLQAEVRRFDASEFGKHTLDVDVDARGVPVAIDFDLANGDDEELAYQVDLTPTR